MKERLITGGRTVWEDRYAYSRAVRFENTIHVTGSVGVDDQGQPGPADDAAAQSRFALDRIEEALEALGSGLRDIVRTRMFVTDIDADHEAIGAVHAERFADVRPATTMVEVAKLIAPWCRVEIEADAIVGSGTRIVHVAEPRIRDAGLNEAEAVARLLEAGGLPVPDQRDRPVSFLVLSDPDGTPIGCVGEEDHGTEALLRSLSIAREERGRGHALALIDRMLARLRHRGVQRVWLFTVGKDALFARRGFRVDSRENMPATVRRTREFELHACDSARVMVREL